MTHDQLQHITQQDEARPARVEEFLPSVRAFFLRMPDVRLAYFQPGPADMQLRLSGPDHARVLIAFTRNITKEQVKRRLGKVRRHFGPLLPEVVEFLDIDALDQREACEAAFNFRAVYGSPEMIERDRLYRYNAFLEWNAGRKQGGDKQQLPPALVPTLDNPPGMVSIQEFITPLYRHLKMIESYVRELRRMTTMELHDFNSDSTLKPLAESYMLKGIQSAILITMSVMHRNMRLYARDYRDLFLLMPVYGMANRERAMRLAKCADVRDKLMFQYEEVADVEVYQNAFEVADCLQEFKTFILEWLFERYYGPSGELIQTE